MSELARRIAELSPEKRELLLQQLNKQQEDASRGRIRPHRKVSNSFPLSFAQQRLWFLHQLEPESPLYNVPIAMRLTGRLDLSAFEQSFNEIVRRHETLRTTFTTVDDQPMQVITPQLRLSLFLIDLWMFPACEVEVRRLEAQEAWRPFDLVQGPLLRICVLRLSQNEHILLLTLHHIVSDGWSQGVLLRELSVHYQAFLNQQPSPLPQLPIQYVDFALWQRERLQGKVLEHQLTYWRQQLQGAPTVMDLPTYRQRPAVQTHHGAQYTFLLSKALSDELKALSQREGATLFMTLLTAFAILLSRYSGQDEVLIGSPIANRTYREVEDLIGFFVNTLVLRCQLSGTSSFRDALAQVREVTLAAYAHQDLPFEQLVEALAPERRLSHAPLVQVLFALQNTPPASLRLTDLQVEQLAVEGNIARFDLGLAMADTGQGLRGALEYNTDLFEETSIRHLHGHFQTLLEGIVAQPDSKLANLPLLKETERGHLLQMGFEPAASQHYHCLHRRFETQVRAHPDAIALHWEEEQLCYAELNARSNQIAHGLSLLGLASQQPVALLLTSDPLSVMALLGVLKVGGIFVCLDPQAPQARISHLLAELQPCCLLTESRYAAEQASLLQQGNTGKVIILDQPIRPYMASSSVDSSSLPTPFVTCSTANPDLPQHPADVAYIAYTSGSTGTPKGIVQTHRNLSQFSSWFGTQFQLRPTKRVAQWAALTFDASYVEIFATLCAGATLCLPPSATRANPPELLVWLYRQQITLFQTVPSFLSVLLQTVCKEVHAFSQLEFLLVAGEVLPVEVAKAALTRFAERTQLFNLYGPTEATLATFYLVEGMQSWQRSIPIGRPIPGRHILILDRADHLCPIGVVGELFIASSYLASGYFQRPQETQEVFLQNPLSDQTERVYRTGDLVRWLSDGAIEFIGRKDRQVKLRGMRVELEEIEAMLMRHASIETAAVVAHENGANEHRLIAYVAPDRQHLIVSELRRYVQEQVPDFMVPADFVVLPALPMLPHGKVDYHALPSPDLHRPVPEHAFVEPRNPVEELLADIWSRVLSIERVGIYDNFFAIGGHSLLATQVVARVREAFHIDLPLRSLFEAPIIASLAERIVMSRQDEPPAIRPLPRDGMLPLSFAQQRQWFLEQFAPGSPAYTIPLVVRLRGPLHVAVLEESLNEIVRRHENLRTTFVIVDRQPVQHIADTLRLPVAVIDLRGCSSDCRQRQVELITTRETQRPFNLMQGPFMRPHLLRLSEEEHIFLLMVHHIVSDGWSQGVLMRELSVLYQAFLSRQPSPLPELPIQYADFARWQRQWLQGEVLQRQVSYWRQQLQGLSILDLPTDFPRPAVQTFQGARHPFVLPEALSESLKTLGRQEGVTLFMVLLAAFQIFLARYSGQDDLVIGTPIANRTHREMEDLIGFFVNTLVLRCQLSGLTNFRDVLAQVREVTLDAYAHQDLPFEQLVETLAPERHLSHAPLVQVLFLLQNTPSVSLGLTDLLIEPVPTEKHTIMFDLTLTLMDTGQGLQGLWNYNTDLFEGTTIRRMHRHFQTLLEGIVNRPDSRLTDLSLMTETEQLHILEQYNPPQGEERPERCIHHWFEEQVRLHPDVIALYCEEEQLCYAELNARSNQIAHGLALLGLASQQPVALLLTSSPLSVIALLGVLKAGGIFVCLDPQAPQTRLLHVLAELRPCCLLTEGHYVSERASLFRQWQQVGTERTIMLDQLPGPHLVALSLERQASSPILFTTCSTANPDLPQHPADVAYIAYTSGSTGTPKGIVQTHRNLSQFSSWFGTQFQLRPTKRVAQWAALTFDPAYVEIFATLCAGATLCLPPSATRSDPPTFLTWLYHEQITLLQTVPSFLRYLLRELELQPVQKPPLPHLEFLIAAGEALPVEVAEVILTQFAGQPRLFNLYGPTEATLATYYEVEDIELQQRSIPIGCPIPGQYIFILDQNSHLCPIGVVGELYIGSSYLALGYFQRSQETRETFLQNPLSHQVTERVYRTGDLGRWRADGTIEFVGRRDHQVKVRGMRIELEEIEGALLGHVSIQGAAVVVWQDEMGEQRLIAYVVPSPHTLSTKGWLAEVQASLRSALPDYMLPTTFVVQEALPLTSSGKVDRQALPPPESAALMLPETFIAPRTPLEEVLAAIFMDVLHRESIGINDDFFAIGGHSLLATLVAARVRETFRRDLPLRSIFEAPTIAMLAEHLVANDQSESHLAAPPLVPQLRNTMLPLSFAQQRQWFLERFAPGSRAYTIPLAVRLSGPLHLAVLERSLNEIVRRHESLRTTFTTLDDHPIQIIAPLLHISLTLIDLGALPACEAEVQRLMAREVQRPFDLTYGPLLRTCLLRLRTQEHVFLLTLHHIVSDGWSQGVLMRELSELYQAFLLRQPSPLPELPIQYVDFARWQRQWLQGEVLQRQVSYWRQQLQGLPILDLPTDFPRPAVQTFQGARHPFVLPNALSESLKTFSQQQGATPFMTLLTTFAVLLARYSGQEDFAIGSPIANRTHVEVEPLIGFFVNTLVLRVDLSGHPTFLDLLARLRQVTLEAYAHQDLPFEMLVQELSPQRAVSHTPLFQVLFMVQNAPRPLLNLPGITLQPLDAESGTAKFDLALSLIETEQGLRGMVEYRTDLFEPVRIQRLIGHYRTLLEGIVSHPHLPAADMPLLTTEERQQFLFEQATPYHDPQDRCVHHLFEEQVAHTPEAIALVWQQQHLSYRELDQRAEQLAGLLRSQGVGPEVIVGVALQRCSDLLIAFLGILKAQGAYLPLDPVSPSQRLSFVLNEARVALVLTHHAHHALLPPFGGKVLCLDTQWEQEGQMVAPRPLSEGQAANLAYVIYTSGSTGQPKGALIDHQSVCNLIAAQRQLFGCQCGDRILQSAALSFDASIWEMMLALMTGATLCLPPPEVLLPGPAFIASLDEQAITVLTLVPSLLAHQPAASLPHLRTLISAGEACPPHLLARWAAQRQFFNAYGPTESTICATVALCNQQMDWLPLGQPLEYVQVYLLDARLHRVPGGTIGELYLGGGGLARGYLQRPDMTAACFVPHPFSTRAGARLYRTGDLARYRTDGTLEFVGRRDRQVKWHGYRVEPGEIESVLRRVEGVQEVVVQLMEDERDDKRLVTYVVAEAEIDLPTNKLRSYAQAQLPAYMVPSAFVLLTALPLTTSGKIDREALPMPDQNKSDLNDTFEAPRTQVEQTIARIWQETLHTQHVGIHDNFFDLGGHSLLLVQVHERVCEAFDRVISLLDLFTYPTISELAEHLQQKQHEKLSLGQSYTRAEIRNTSRGRRRQIRQVVSDEQH